jgi:hypothetical protein
MPLEPEDTHRLFIWSFLTDFKKLRADFIDLARIAYNSTKDLKGTKPDPDDCESLYSGLLLNAPIFQGVLARKYFLSPTFYRASALAFARYVLHNNWNEIST